MIKGLKLVIKSLRTSAKRKNINKLRNEARQTPEYKQWRKAVYSRDGYQCQICNRKKYLNAHHLRGFSQYIYLRYDVNNGITLCSFCHKKFHEQYGKTNFPILTEVWGTKINLW